MFNLRRHFLLDPSVVFPNHGSLGATPRPVFRAYQDWGRELERPTRGISRPPLHGPDGGRADLVGRVLVTIQP